MLKFSIFKLKSLFISYEFNIPGVIASYAFLWHLKKITIFGGLWIALSIYVKMKSIIQVFIDRHTCNT